MPTFKLFYQLVLGIFNELARATLAVIMWMCNELLVKYLLKNLIFI